MNKHRIRDDRSLMDDKWNAISNEPRTERTERSNCEGEPTSAMSEEWDVIAKNSADEDASPYLTPDEISPAQGGETNKNSNNGGCDTTVVISNLPHGTTEEELYHTFEKFDKIFSARVVRLTDDKCIGLVSYKTSESAVKAVNEQNIILHGRRLQVQYMIAPRVPIKKPPTNFLLKVSNLPEKIPLQEICNIFQVHGTIITFDEENHIAYVPFTTENDVDRWVAKYNGSLMIRHNTVELKLDKCGDQDLGLLTYFLVKASNLPDKISSKEVYNIFREHGEITVPPNVQIDEENNIAYVPFTSLIAAKKLLTNSKGSLMIRHDTVTIEIEEFFGKVPAVKSPTDHDVTRRTDQPPGPATSSAMPTSADNRGNKSARIPETVQQQPKFSMLTTDLKNCRAIQIRNIRHSSPTLLKQYVSIYGGEVEKFLPEEKYDLAVVVFKDADAVQKILAKSDGHKLEDQFLYMTKLPPICTNQLFFDNIPEWLSSGWMENSLWARANCRIKNPIQFREDNCGAVVTFQNAVDAKDLQEKIRMDPIKDDDQHRECQMLIHPVVSPDAVLVYGNVPSKDSLRLAFEDYLHQKKVKAPSGCSVRYVVNKEEHEKTSLVIFDDYNVVSTLPNKIIIGGNSFPLVPFHDYLGWIPYECDGKRNVDILRKHPGARVTEKLSDQQFKFLSMSTGDNFVKGELSRKGWNLCVTRINHANHSLEVTGSNKDESESIMKFVFSCMKTFTIGLTEEMLKCWKEKSSSFLQNRSELQLENTYFCTLSDRTLTVTAAASEADKIKTRIQDFFNENAIHEEIIQIDRMMGQYLKKYYSFELKSKCNNQNIFLENGNLCVKGTKSQVKIFEMDVNMILCNIQISLYDVNQPGMATFFRKQGSANINDIMEQTETLIVSESDSESTHLSDSPENLFKGVLNGKVKIIVRQGDITAESVDAIVNAANDGLSHDGGLAAAIVENGGQIIQTECTLHIANRKNNLNEGDVFVSTAGKLKCKKVIHAVGPRWRGGNSNEPFKLNNAIVNVLIAANQNNLHSIAIPAISTNIFGYPLDKAVPIIVEAIDIYCRDGIGMVKNGITEIRLVDTNKEAIVKFKEELVKIRGFQKVLAGQSTPKTNVALNRPSGSAADMIRATVLHIQSIKLVKDDIVNVAKQCNVIVNSTGSDMTGGATARSILIAAGPTYLADIKKNYPQGLQNIPLGVTTAGQLGCKHVFHIVCPDRTARQTNSVKQVLVEKVELCLNEASKRGLSSIAFPAIGTGNLKYPANICAKTMLNTVDKWLNSNQQSTVKMVLIVVFPSDTNTVKAFETEFNNNAPSVPQTVGVKVDLIQTRNEKVHYIIYESDDQIRSAQNRGTMITIFDGRKDVLLQNLFSANNSGISVVAILPKDSENEGATGGNFATMLLQTIKSFADNEKDNKIELILIAVSPSSYSNYLQEMSEQDDVDNGSTEQRTRQDIPQVVDSHKLYVCGKREKVQEALNRLDNLCDAKCRTITRCRQIIGYLDDEKTISDLQTIARDFEVELTVEPLICSAQVKGYRAPEFQIRFDQVLDAMTETFSNQCGGDTAKVRWYKRHLQNYPWQQISSDVSNTSLEAAFTGLDGKGSVQLVIDNNEIAVADFDKMKVIQENNVLYSLKRKDDSDSIPLEWDYNGKLGQNEYSLIPLDPNLEEFGDIKKAVLATRDDVTISKIERVENPIRYCQYDRQKQSMKQSHKSHLPLERQLFHGTESKNVAGICREGFDRGLNGVHGVAYGKGVYFAKNFANSAKYGKSTVFYAHVLTGEIAVGNKDMKTAPVNEETGKKYGSVVDNVDDPNIFVIFSDNQAYPAYLITYA